jgi:hypothetical protein
MAVWWIVNELTEVFAVILLPVGGSSCNGRFSDAQPIYFLKQSLQHLASPIEFLELFKPCFREILCGSFLRPGTAVVQWLRCCATNRKVAGSISDGVIGIFH